VRNLDTRTTMLGARLISDFTFRLQTVVELTATFNTYPLGGGVVQDLDYTTLLVGARYAMLDRRLFLNGSVAPWFGDIRRTVVDLGAEYRFTPTFGLRMDYGLYLNQGIPNDAVWNLRATYDI